MCQRKTLVMSPNEALIQELEPVREGDYVGVGVDAPLGAAAPHTLHAVARAVGARRP